MDEVVYEFMLRDGAVILRHPLRIKEKGVLTNGDIPAVQREDRRRFQDQQQTVAGAVRPFDLKIRIVTVIVSDMM
jgi:hypothetical protein